MSKIIIIINIIIIIIFSIIIVVAVVVVVIVIFVIIIIIFSDEMIRIVVGFRLGLRTCENHTCPCGKEVNVRGLRGLSCRHSSAGQQRHAELNDIIWR